MNTVKELIHDYRSFSESLMNKMEPNASQLIPGFITYEESYLLKFFAARKQFQQELIQYLNTLVNSIDSPHGRNKLYKELSELSKAYYEKYTERYLRSQAT